MPRPLLILALLASSGGCATTRRAGVCPESENLKCLTAPECSHDAQRGCDVCQCSSPYPNGTLPPPAEPDRK